MNSRPKRPSPPARQRGAPPAATAIRALTVLDVIGNQGRPVRFTELVQATGLSKATLHRMLAALIASGFVSFDDDSGTYWIGMRIVDLAGAFWDSLDLRSASDSVLSRLRQLTGQTSLLGVLDGGHVVYLDERAALQEVRIFYNAGRRLPAHCTAIGKAILAFMPERQRYATLSRNLLATYTDKTLTSLPDLEREFSIIRERSYAVDDEELEIGRRSIAAPIFEHGGQPLAAIAVSGPASEMTLERCHELAAEVLACAALVRPQAHPAQTTHAIRSIAETETSKVRCLQPATAFLGDSPIWDERQKLLYWVDIVEPAIHVFDPETRKDQAKVLPSLVGSIGLREKGGLVLALQSGLHLLDADGETLSFVEAPEKELPHNRFNDGAVDRAGRFWVGSMSMAREAGKASLYRLDGDLKVTRMDTGFTLCNGLDWSPDNRTMYLVDSVARTIFAYDFDLETGEISNRRTFATMPESRGALGGLAVDAEGGVWSALQDGASVVRFTAGGQIGDTVAMPVPRPAGLAFGGPQYATLFVTSSRLRLPSWELSRAPLSGSVFAFEPGVSGVPTARFAG